MKIRSIVIRSFKATRYLWPWFLFARFTRPIPPGLWLANGFLQRVLRIGGKIPWMVHYTSYVSGHIQIGENVWKSFALSGGCYMQGRNGIYLGDNVLFAPGVKIISANHDPRDMATWLPSPPIRIGHRCWIGVNAVILPGVELGDECIVGAGAVVTQSFPTGSIIAGVPAKTIGFNTSGKTEQ